MSREPLIEGLAARDAAGAPSHPFGPPPLAERLAPLEAKIAEQQARIAELEAQVLQSPRSPGLTDECKAAMIARGWTWLPTAQVFEAKSQREVLRFQIWYSQLNNGRPPWCASWGVPGTSYGYARYSSPEVAADAVEAWLDMELTTLQIGRLRRDAA